MSALGINRILYSVSVEEATPKVKRTELN